MQTPPLSTNPETPPTPPSPQALTPPTPPTSKPPAILIFILLIMAVAAVSFLLGKYSSRNKTPAPTAKVTPKPTLFPTPTPDLTVGWKTFVGKPIFAESDWPQFTINYPPEWKRDGNLLYPLGKNPDKKLEARVSLGFSIRTLPEPQTKKVFLVIENLPSHLEDQYK